MARKRATKPMKKMARGKAAKKPAGRLESAAAAIRRLDAEFMRTANAHDAGALVQAFYAKDAVLLPPNQPAVEGRENIRGFLQGLMDAGLTSIKLETTSVASAGGLACGRGRYTLSIQPPGGAPITEQGKYVVVYQPQAGGGWRAVTDIFNSDQPAQ
ncbi:MAG TPA: DUF4440 domain-containing protein [Methylomirabilota bacterium]|nr:DUF4440 domain-containing protein [Methylomirabilota bacterium]